MNGPNREELVKKFRDNLRVYGHTFALLEDGSVVHVYENHQVYSWSADKVVIVDINPQLRGGHSDGR